jgi:hypothetical protein
MVLNNRTQPKQIMSSRVVSKRYSGLRNTVRCFSRIERKLLLIVRRTTPVRERFVWRFDFFGF